MWQALKNLPRWLRFSLIFPLLSLNGFLLALLINYLQPLISFLIIAAILAFLLELAVKWLGQRGVKRGIAIAAVLIASLLIFALVALILVPLMVQQLGELVEKSPEWIEQANRFVISKLPLFERLSIDLDSLIQQITTKLSTLIQKIGGQTLNLILGTVTSVFNLLLILILTVFLGIGGEQFWAGLFSWFPAPWNQKIPEYLEQTFKDYFFTRLILAGASSVARLIVFIILGVPSALLFAFAIGIGNLIPFVGGIITIAGTLLLIFKSGKLAFSFWLAATIIDQLTDNVIAPRLMGDAIGINPIWLIIALFLGAKLGGLLGLFLAVPLASVIKRIVDDLRFSEEEEPEPADPLI